MPSITPATRQAQLNDARARLTLALRDMREFRNVERRAHVRRHIAYVRQCQEWLDDALIADIAVSLRRAA